MAKFVIDVPEKTYTRYRVEAHTIEEALNILKNDDSVAHLAEIVVSDEYHSNDTLNPADHSWYYLVDGYGNEQRAYRFVFGQWIASKPITNIPIFRLGD